MKTAKQNLQIQLSAQNAKRVKKVCKAVKLTPDFLINDLLSRIDLVVVVKPKEYSI